MINSITLAFSIALFLLLIPVGLVVLLYLLILVVYLMLIGYASIMVAVKNTILTVKRRRRSKRLGLAPVRGKALDRMALLYGTRRQEKKVLGFIKVKESDKKLRLRLTQTLLPNVKEACYQINSEIRDRT